MSCDSAAQFDHANDVAPAHLRRGQDHDYQNAAEDEVLPNICKFHVS